MNTVQAGKVTIGEGRPKICVPVTGVTEAEILEQAEALQHIPADMAEWRADWYEYATEPEKVLKVLGEIKEVLGEIPLLFTFRTAAEGGEKEIGTAAYVELNQAVSASGHADLIDVEAFGRESAAREILKAAHGYGVKVIGSNHDFEKTPDRNEIIKRLCFMQKLGVDITKIAVMPRCREDVLVLLCATEEMNRKYARQPVITMSMGKDGLVSRLCGEVFGSAVTFGMAGRASAPGQIEAEKLVAVLEIFHNTRKPSELSVS